MGGRDIATPSEISVLRGEKANVVTGIVWPFLPISEISCLEENEVVVLYDFFLSPKLDVKNFDVKI